MKNLGILTLLTCLSLAGLVRQAAAQTVDEAYASYRAMNGAFKAFAASPSDGSWGRATGSSVDDAQAKALAFCNRYAGGNDCAVYAVGDKLVRKLNSAQTYPLAMKVVGDDGKRIEMRGSARLADIFAKSTGVTITSDGGNRICQGSRTFVGNARHNYKLNCFGKQYTGVLDTRRPQLTIRSTQGGQIDMTMLPR